ncbi:MAG: hypothetical protein GXO73_00035 [Calditrichaeota bacterium]|nr:hypothetical protein [Calditrichota bacterium]
MRRNSLRSATVLFAPFWLTSLIFLASTPGCSLFSEKLPSPGALIDSVEATYKPFSRAYKADLDVYVPLDHGQGVFHGWLRVHAADSSEIHVQRGHDEWVRLTGKELKIHRESGKPLVEQLTNINHEPILVREIFVLGPDIFSWLGDTYTYEQVRKKTSRRLILTARPKKSFSAVGRLEVEIDPRNYHVIEARLYAKNGDLAGRYTFDDFVTVNAYPVPRSVGIDFAQRGEVTNELYRLRHLRALSK